MKKIVIAVLFVSLTMGAHALNLSAGVGTALYFSSVTLKLDESSQATFHYIPIIIEAFFDATYLQISIGYDMVNGGTATASGVLTASNPSDSSTYVSFAAFGRYPFVVGPVTIFPLLGIEYDLNLTVKDSSGNNDLKSAMTSQQQSDLNELWFKGGAGADFTFGRFYSRLELLLGLKLLSTTDYNELTFFNDAGFKSASLSYFNVSLDLLAGYRL
jgi:hypothetical protein